MSQLGEECLGKSPTFTMFVNVRLTFQRPFTNSVLENEFRVP